MGRLTAIGLGLALASAALDVHGQPAEPAPPSDEGTGGAAAEPTEPPQADPPPPPTEEPTEPTTPDGPQDVPPAPPTPAASPPAPAAPAVPTGAPPPESSSVTVASTETQLIELPPPDALGGDEEDGPRGWIYPVLGAGVDVTPPVGSDVGDEFTLSVGFALEGMVGLSPYAQLGGYLRLGFGGLDSDYHGDALQTDESVDTHAVRVGLRARVVAPSLGNAVTPFGDFSFGYSQLVLGVDGVIETCSENAAGDTECVRDLVEDREYEAMAFGFGGGLAFETSQWGEPVAGVDDPATLKVFVRGTFFYEDWLGGPLDDAALEALNLHHVEIAAGLIYW